MRNKVLSIIAALSIFLGAPANATLVNYCDNDFSQYKSRIFTELFYLKDDNRSVKKPTITLLSEYSKSKEFIQACRENDIYGGFYRFIKENESYYRNKQKIWDMNKSIHILVKHFPENTKLSEY